MAQSTPVTTDYTAKGNPDSLTKGAMTEYRIVHWLADTLRNFFSDPINIRDERICGLLRMQDGATETTLNALFKVGVPFNPKDHKSGTTPAIIVGAGEMQFVNPIVNSATGIMPLPEFGGNTMYGGIKTKRMTVTVSVITESYDGTMLLTDLIADFLAVNELQLIRDNGMISQFLVSSVTGIQDIQDGALSNAKPVYGSNINITVQGSIAWQSDHEGPVYRGLTVK